MQKTCPVLAVRIERVSDVKGVGDLAFLVVESQALQAGNDIMRGAKLFQALIGELLLVFPPKDALTVVT